MTTTHARYQHTITLVVGEYPRDMAAMFPELRELKDGEKPLAYKAAVVPAVKVSKAR